MGSGARFRLQTHRGHRNWYFVCGISLVPNSEHRFSISIHLGFHTIYIGIGKGYDE